MEQVIIKKSEWLRGEGDARSYLKRPEDGKKCCVGFFCEQVLHRSDVDGLRTIDRVDASIKYQWVDELYSLNDSVDTTDAYKMKRLSKIAANNGYAFVFVE